MPARTFLPGGISEALGGNQQAGSFQKAELQQGDSGLPRPPERRYWPLSKNLKSLWAIVLRALEVQVKVFGLSMDSRF